MTAPAAARGVGSAADVGGAFFPDALEANRAGQLTDAQRRGFAAYDRSWRRGEVGLALVFVVLAALLLSSTGPAPNAALRPFAGVGFLVLALAVAVHATPSRDPLARDLRSRRVESLEAAMEKHTFNIDSRGSSLTAYYLDIGDLHFEVHAAEYEAAPAAGIVRVYFLPQSHKVVNLERLPDRPVDPAMLESPTAAVQTLLHAMRARGDERHEAMASMAAVGDALKAERAAAAVPPPPEQRDPRPLAEAIIGTWVAGPMTLTFGADGTIGTTMPGGHTQAGRWSVDAAGHLHADALGHDEAGDAWIVGDTLTLSSGGQGMSFHRAQGA